MSRVKIDKKPIMTMSSVPYVGTLERNMKFKGKTPGKAESHTASHEKKESVQWGKESNAKPKLHGKNENVLGTFNKAAKSSSPMEEHPRFLKHPGELAYGFKNAGPYKK